MRYIHFRDDFSIQEKFYTDDGNGGKTVIDVPERVEIEFFTVQGRSRFVARRNGSEFENCELSADGKTLTVFVSLRNKPIGHGRLLRLVTQISEDASFPDGLKYTRFPGREDAVLYLGKSDGPLDLTSEIVFREEGVTLERVWQSLQNNTDFPNEKINLCHIPSIPISGVEGLQEALDNLDREIPSLEVLLALSEMDSSLASRLSSLEAWVENPTMGEAFIQLLNVEELNGVRAFLSGELSVAGLATIAGGLLVSTTKRIYFGDTAHYLELTADGEFHFSHGVYSDDYMAADGIGSHGGGGGGGADLAQVWSSLTNQSIEEEDITPTIKIATDHIPDLSISKIAGLQEALGTKQDTISDLATIRSNASAGATAYSWGNHATAGYLLASVAAGTYATITSLDNLASLVEAGAVSASEQLASLASRLSSLEALVENPTMGEAFIQLLNTEELNGVRALLSGELSVAGLATIAGGLLVSSTKRIYFGDTDHYLELTADGEFHFSHGVYSDDYMAADGIGSHGGGGGGGADLAQVWSSLTNQSVEEEDITPTIKIATDHIPDLGMSKIAGLQEALGTKQDTISDLATIRSNASAGATAYSWGNHANAGYLLASVAAETYATITALGTKQDIISDLATIRSNASAGATAYSWGNHANAGYLLASVAAGTYATITSTLALAEEDATAAARLSSLESWFLHPELAELYTGILDTDEIDLSGLVLSGSSGGVFIMNGNPVFSSLANSGNQIAVTIGGQQRTLTVNFATNCTNASAATNATYATNDASGRNIVSTYQTISEDLETQKSNAEGLGNLYARVASLEDWFARPSLGEAFIQQLDVEEIYGSNAYLYNRVYFAGKTAFIEWDVSEAGLHFNTGIYSDAYISGDGVSTSSDARLKKNLQDVKLTVAQIAETRAVTFDWVDESKGSGAGTIAQDWEDLIPQNVHRWTDDMLSIEYGNIALISAIVIAREVKEQSGLLKEQSGLLKDVMHRIEIIEHQLNLS